MLACFGLLLPRRAGNRREKTGESGFCSNLRHFSIRGIALGGDVRGMRVCVSNRVLIGGSGTRKRLVQRKRRLCRMISRVMLQMVSQ